MVGSRKPISSASRRPRGRPPCGGRQLCGSGHQARTMALQPILNMLVELGDGAGPDRDGPSPSPGWFRSVGPFPAAVPAAAGRPAGGGACPAGRARRRSAGGCRRGPGRRTTAAARPARRSARASACGRRPRRRAAPPAAPASTGSLPRVRRPPAGGAAAITTRISRAASPVSTQAAMICSSSISLMPRRRSYSTSDSCVPRGGGMR